MEQQQDPTGTKFFSGLMFVVVSVISGVLIAGLFVPIAALAGVVAGATADAMENLPMEFHIPEQAERTSMYTLDGVKIADLYDDDRTYVTLDQISPNMITAQLAIEDKRFYEHGALDFRGTLRAIIVSQGQQGGSTISQQFVKQVQIENARANADDEGVVKAQERTIARKIQELRYAVAVERTLSKDKILENYLNIAYYADGSYGVESAARHFFSKPAKDLTIAESALLAGIVKNPSQYNPVSYPDSAIERRNVVLGVMLSNGAITQEQYDEAIETEFDQDKVTTRRKGCYNSTFPFLCDYAERELQKYSGFGNSAESRKDNLYRNGYSIYLTVDSKKQLAAEQNLHSIIGPKDPFIGLMNFVDPKTGRIQIMAQSKNKMGDIKDGKTYYNYNVTKDMGGAEGYQPGSTFKAFTLAAALAQGTPITQRFNSPTRKQFKGTTFKSCEGEFIFQDSWQPTNDGGLNGTFDMITATQQSVNTYYIQLEAKVGICEAAKMAEATGIKLTGTIPVNEVGGGNPETWKHASTRPSFTLGITEVAPVTVAQSFATFANRGKRCDLTIISEIRTKKGTKVKYPEPKCHQVIEPKVADAVAHVLSKVTEGKGSGTPMAIPGYTIAGKTGTTNGAENMWWTGFTPDMAGTSAIVSDKQHSFWKGKSPRDSTTVPSSLMQNGNRLLGYGMDAGKFWTPTMRMMLADIQNPTKFVPIADEYKSGKLVDIPKLTGDADKDEDLLFAAGFNVERVDIDSTEPKGTYIGPSKRSGQAPQGSTIKLYFSAGKDDEKKDDEEDDDEDKDKGNGSQPGTTPTAAKTTVPVPTVKPTSINPKPTVSITVRPKPTKSEDEEEE